MDFWPQEMREKRQQEEFEKKKEKGMLHVSNDRLATMDADEARMKEKRKAGMYSMQDVSALDNNKR